MKCQPAPEGGSGELKETLSSEGSSTRILEPDTSDTNKKPDPDISLEWQDMKITFRIVSDFDWDQEQKNRYELFPQFDSTSPSSRNIPYMKRKANRERYNGSTLTSFLGHMPSDAQTSSKASSQPKTSQDSPTKTSISPIERHSVDASYKKISNVDGVKNVQDVIDGPKKCHICGKGFTKASYLKRHVLSHSSVKPYRCDICNWGFFQHCNLKRHMASHTLENGAAGFKCEHCSANFTTKSVLSVHLRDAHGDKLLTKKEAQRSAVFDRTSPSSSGSVFNTNPNTVTKGPLVSRGGFPPRITVGRGGQVARMGASPMARMGASPMNGPFITRPQSSTPQKFSSGPSALIGVSNISSPGNVSVNGWSRCHICNKSFLTPANLKQHMLLHPGSKPFRCNFCGMRFAQKINLKKHMVCHVAGNGHPCPHCNINFRTKDDVAQHVLKQHSDALNRNTSPSASTPKRQPEQRIHQNPLMNVPQRAQGENKTERFLMSNEGQSINQHSMKPLVKPTEEAIQTQEQHEMIDDEEEMEIPAPDQSSHSSSEDHFVLQGNPVTSFAPQTIGGALPVSNPNSGNKGGLYTCSICMESFDKVGLLNKHIIFKHST